MHIPVLLEESIESLKIKKGDVVVDATLGAGGHSLKIAQKVGEKGKVVAIDIDAGAIEEFKQKIGSEHPDLQKRFIFIQGNFACLRTHLEEQKIKKVNGILADLGWRIEQVRDKKYGMSFLEDSRLDMRLDRDQSRESAFEIVNNLEEKELERIFCEFGEEKNSRKIAREIAKRRKESPIETTMQLADLVESVSRRGKSGIHPATRVFQALRIKVNNELENVEKFLSGSLELLESKGRVSVITFHSLEDRIVKKFFQSNARGCVCPKEFPICICGKKERIKIITKKPVVPSLQELKKNPRSRSAKLRVAEKI